MNKDRYHIGEVYVAYPIATDDAEDVMYDTQIELPDGRGVYEWNKELYLRADDYFEKYNPVLNLLWEDKLQRIRDIVKNKQFAMVEGNLVDSFSASHIIKVYDNLCLKHKLQFLSKPIPVMADIAFKLLK